MPTSAPASAQSSASGSTPHHKLSGGDIAGRTVSAISASTVTVRLLCLHSIPNIEVAVSSRSSRYPVPGTDLLMPAHDAERQHCSSQDLCAGIAIGAAVGAALLAALGFFAIKRIRQSGPHKTSNQPVNVSRPSLAVGSVIAASDCLEHGCCLLLHACVPSAGILQPLCSAEDFMTQSILLCSCCISPPVSSPPCSDSC